MAEHRLIGSVVTAAVTFVLMYVVLIPFGSPLVLPITYAPVFGAVSWWSWRPGGRARLHYERRVEDERLGYPNGWRPGWYGDPNRQHRVRFWTGTAWTDWVADGEDMFREGYA